MTTDEQNMAIAKALNWRPTVDGGICWDNKGKPIVAPPYYTNDLNAMHEAERVLTMEQCGAFEAALQASDALPYPAGLNVWHATAAQRAEAFLKTLNLWKE